MSESKPEISSSRENPKKLSWRRRIAFRFLATIVGLFVAVLVLEVGLRIYNPFYTTIQGDRIVLRANREFKYDGEPEYGTDEKVVYRTNSLGFRGPDPSDDHTLRVITVGGSTTNSLTLNEQSTWSGQVRQKLLEFDSNSWLNNAGFVGHTTFAHQQLLQEHVLPLKPDYILLLVGINDVGMNVPSHFDRDNLRGLDFSSAKGFAKSLSCYSELIALGINLVRWKRAADRGLPYHGMHMDEFDHVDVETEKVAENILEEHRKEFIPGYQQRIKSIINACQENKTELVLVTQPTLYGEGNDDVTGINLETLKVELSDGISGRTHWHTVELYNDVLREAGQKHQLLVIDLARRLPKSSANFYDEIHFTKEGSSRIADIIWEEFHSKVLSDR